MATIPLKKRSKGRRKMPMQLITRQSNRMVTFSKRRIGLFKKASEICTLTGSEVAIVVSSPGGKALSYGHPNVDIIIDRFLFGDGFHPMHAVQGNREVMELNKELTILKDQLAFEQKRTDYFQEVRKLKGDDAFKFLIPEEQITFEELKQTEALLIRLRNHVLQHHNRLVKAHLDQNVGPSPRQNLMGQGQTLSNLPSTLEGENLYPNPNNQTFGDPSKMSMVPPPLVRGPNDNPPMVMIPTPMRVLREPSLAARPSEIGEAYGSNFPSSSSVPNPMGADFARASLVQPFQGASNPTQGYFAECPNLASSMGTNPTPSAFRSFTSLLLDGEKDENASLAPNPTQGYLDGRQDMASSMGMNPTPSALRSFTSLFNREYNENASIAPNSTQGHFVGRQDMASSMGMNPTPSALRSFTSLLDGEYDENTAIAPNSTQGHFVERQDMASSMGMNPSPSAFQSFTSFLLDGEYDENTYVAPFNPQG